MKDVSDIAWIDEYKQKMGEKAFENYSNELYAYIDKMPIDSDFVISNIVMMKNEDLFAKCICRFVYLECFNLQFSADFTKLRKFEKKNGTISTSSSNK